MKLKSFLRESLSSAGLRKANRETPELDQEFLTTQSFYSNPDLSVKKSKKMISSAGLADFSRLSCSMTWKNESDRTSSARISTTANVVRNSPSSKSSSANRRSKTLNRSLGSSCSTVCSSSEGSNSFLNLLDSELKSEDTMFPSPNKPPCAPQIIEPKIKLTANESGIVRQNQHNNESTAAATSNIDKCDNNNDDSDNNNNCDSDSSSSMIASPRHSARSTCPDIANSMLQASRELRRLGLSFDDDDILCEDLYEDDCLSDNNISEDDLMQTHENSRYNSLRERPLTDRLILKEQKQNLVSAFTHRLEQLEALIDAQACRQAELEKSIDEEVERRIAKKLANMDEKVKKMQETMDETIDREINRRTTEVNDLTIDCNRTSGRNMYRSLAQTKRRQKNLTERLSINNILRSRRQSELSSTACNNTSSLSTLKEFVKDLNTNAKIVLSNRNSCPDSGVLIFQGDEEEISKLPRRRLAKFIVSLREHMITQDTQLEEAKRLINIAIVDRESAEETAQEAMSLTVFLDHRLDVVTAELSELRRKTEPDMSMEISSCEKQSNFKNRIGSSSIY